MNDITPLSIQNPQQVTKPGATVPRRYITSVNGVDKLEKTGKTDAIDKPAKMLLELLKSSLNDTPVNEEVFKGANYSDWAALLKISQESSVSGMALDATEKLPGGTVPKDVEMKMVRIQKESAARHAQQEKIIGEISEMFAKKGIETIQMKGVGFSMEYPEPTNRFGGDIDIFTRKKGTQTIGHSNTYETVDNMITDMGIEVEDKDLKQHKHSEFEYKGVRIENHRYFINKERMPEAGILDEFLHKSINPREKVLPHGTKILVPSKEFNSVFIAHHAFQHYVFSGIDIHHLTDWAAHIKNNGLTLPDEVKGTKFEKFTNAFTNLSNRYLGTNVKVPENKKFEDEIFNTLLHPEKAETPKEVRDGGPLKVFSYKMTRFIKNSKKAHEYTGDSYTEILRRALERKIKKPMELFRYK